MAVDVAGIEGVYRLSPVQEGMLFHALSAPGSGIYFEQFTTAYDEGLDPDVFAVAWRQVLARHPVLRTSFLWEDLEEPVQVVHRQVELELERLDWRDRDPCAQQRDLTALAAADQRRGFDLTQPPLLRFTLVRFGERAWRLIWSYHHLLLDGWSAGLVMHEAAALYQALARGEMAALPARRPFQSYVLWLLQQDPAAAAPYWRRVLAGFRQPTPLVVDAVANAGGHPGEPGDAGYELRLTRLAADTTARLKSFAQRHRLTLSTLVHGAWALLLARYSGEEDVVFGTTVSGRPPSLPGVESMIGCFINTLPVRVAAPPEAALAAWLQGLQKGLLELRQHEHTPLLDVLGWAEVPRHLPLFESILVFESFTAESAFAMSHSGVFQRTNYPLTLAVSPAQELALRLGFEPARFPPGAMLRMLSHLETLLAAMPESRPDRPLRTLPLLPPAQRAQVLAEWNDTAAAPPRQLGLHQPFEDQARRAPDSPALLFGGEMWTYGELNARANRLAHRLRALGLAPGALVGVYMERSGEMVRAVLAVLKAGGAYVPLETAWPLERVRFILESQGITHVVTEGERAERLGALPSLPRLAHVVSVEPFAELPETDPPAAVIPEALAYIIFTSGSTGRPKGVMVEHLPAVHLIDWVNRTFAVGPADRLLFVAALSFDLSVYDIFGTLAAGASLRIASQPELDDPEALVGILRREPITFWDSAPAALNRLAPYFPAPGLIQPALRLVFLSGDWIPVPLPDRVRDTFPGARVIALGGATEATVWSNWYPVGTVDASWPSIPYGRPIDDARYHVLDAALEPCPIGVAGDLYIGGDGCLSTGYAGEPGLTAQQYLPSPAGGEPGGRLYRTGDRARYLPDGNLEFLGRLDTQVKVRGFRIELGEIEAVLSAHPAVREAVAVVREDRPGDQRLVAYVIFREGHPETEAADLREHLRARLPEAMVPGAFVRLDSWPLTANGKLDRRALPAPEQAGRGEAVPRLAPRTATERAVAEIWQQVLAVDEVGVEDDFHELGGHSLLLVQMAGKVRERFGKELPLAYLLPHRTVASLAEAVDQGLGGQALEAPSPTALGAQLRAGAVLDPALVPALVPVNPPAGPSQASALDPRAVFITGGTGFLGAYLLAELLRQSTAAVFCLVRAADPPTGLAKLRRELESYGLWDPSLAPRITAVPGDLSRPLFGLSEADFARLAASVEAIYHNGAVVDFLAPYAMLKAANVQGTVEVLRLACRGAAKPLHYVSTLGVLDSAAHAAAGVAREDDPLGDCAGLTGGYAQSKWVAEALVLAARDRGLPVAVYRPGTISGDSDSGQANLKDFANSLIKGCIQLGAVPHTEARVNLAPVDFVGRAIVWLSRQRESWGRTFHMLNPRPVAARELIDWIRAAGYPLDELPPEAWREALLRKLANGEENALAPFQSLFEAAAARASLAVGAPTPAAVEYDGEQTFRALARGPVTCPPVAELLATYFSYFVRSGFLPAPAAARNRPAGPPGQETPMTGQPTADETAGPRFPGSFVLSLPRTGSTLLRLLLDSHPEVYCPDELNLGRLVHALSSTEEGLTEPPNPSGPAMADIDPASPAAVETRRIVGEMLAAAAAARGKALWCDKSPANLEHVPVIERIFPEARYLVLHRHALDFAMSCLRFSTYGFFLTVVDEYVRKDHRNFLRALLQAWNDKTAELLDFERRHAGRCLRLRYEDLVADPAATLERICDFLGVERVPDLAKRVFSSPHQQRAYHGDPKAYYSSGIADSSVGSGAELNLSALRLVPADQLERMNALLTALAYPAAEISAGGIDLHMGPGRQPAASSQEAPSHPPAELFALLGQRLAQRPVPASIAGTAFAFVLTGEAGGAWTVDLSQAPGQVVSGSDSAPTVLTLAASDFAGIVTGRLNPALAFQQGKLKLTGAADPGMLRDLLALLLAP